MKLSDIALDKLSTMEAAGYGTQLNGKLKVGAPVRIFVRDVAIAAKLSTGYTAETATTCPATLDSVTNELRAAGFVITYEAGKRFVSLTDY